MAIFVRMTYNPYAQQLQILINGEKVSSYSILKKYANQPFVKWCDEIFDAIHQECNYGKYRIIFCSREEEIRIMQKMADLDSCCEQFTFSLPVQNKSLPQRMADLSHLLKQNGKVKIPRQRIRTQFFLDPMLGQDLIQSVKELEISNSYCEVQTDITTEKKQIPGADVYFKISATEQKEWEAELPFSSGFYIEKSDETGFLGKRGQVFAYRTTEGNLFETIFSCFLLYPLLKVFIDTVKQLPEEFKNRYKHELESMFSIWPAVIPKSESYIIELGRSKRITFSSDMPEYKIDINKLRFEYSMPGIITCNGFQIDGLKVGNAVLWIYRNGENNPCASVNCEVIRRNRITEISLEEQSVVLGEGDKYQLNCIWYPGDADNVNTISWKSDHPDIAEVDAEGVISGIKEGVCTIYCMAEQVSTSCMCMVKPYLKNIIPYTNEIEILYGTTYELSYCLEPEECIDNNIEIISKDLKTVNVVGNTIKGTGTGQTTVVLQNSRKTVNAQIQVTVLDERQWKKHEKKKKGFWANLFK